MSRLLAALVLILPAAFADEDDQEKRLRDLERQNRELRERVDNLEAQRGLKGEIDDYLEEETEEGLGLNLVIRKGNTQGTFQIFGDVGARYDNPAVPNRSNSFFFNGSLDIFFTARVGDHFHVLSETVFQTRVGEPGDSSKFDQERLWGAWAFSDRLQILFGLEHSHISLWNRILHHGRWLELTVMRPFLARFESGSGILPMHDAGIEFSGSIRTPRGQFSYSLFISNGRGRVITEVQEFSDRNDDKAVTFGFGFRPDGVHGLLVSIFVRTEAIPADTRVATRMGSVREYVATFQVRYDSDRIELLSEFAYIEDQDRTVGMDFEHYTGYLQVGVHLDDQWTPYFRIDFREMDLGDPYYMEANRDLDAWELLFGIRFDFIENAALKFEVGFGDREQRDDDGVVHTRGYIRIATQLSWVF